MKIRVINKLNRILRSYYTVYSTGMNLRANQEADIVLNAHERKLVPTEFNFQISEGYDDKNKPITRLAKNYVVKVLTGTEKRSEGFGHTRGI